MVRFSMQTAAAAAGMAAPPSKRMRIESAISDCAASAPPIASASDSVGAPAATSFLATFDVDTLDCSVCMESLTPPIFQCSNGHIACHSCRDKIEDSCPSCSGAMGKIRCLAIEKLIETLRVTCKFADYGCGLMLKFVQRAAHERSCIFKPCSCPIKPCVKTAASKDMPEHLEESHKLTPIEFPSDTWYTLCLSAADTHVLLNVDGVPFLLIHEKEAYGSRIHLVCFTQQDYSCEFEVKNGKKRCLFEADPQSLAQAEAAAEFYVVPSHMHPKEGHLQLQILLRHAAGASKKTNYA